MKRFRTFLEALYRLYEHSGFAMAGAVAFSFVVSIFPFCIFLGALSGVFGGRELATQAITQLFDILPRPVAEGLAPEVAGDHGHEPHRPADGQRISCAVLRHERHRDHARGAERRLPGARDAALPAVPADQHAVRVRQRRLDAGADLGRCCRSGARASDCGAVADRRGSRRCFDSNELRAGRALSRSPAVVIAVQLFAFHLWLAAGKRRVAGRVAGNRCSRSLSGWRSRACGRTTSRSPTIRSSTPACRN